LLLTPVTYGAEFGSDAGQPELLSESGQPRTSLGFVAPRESAPVEPVRRLIEPTAPPTLISDAPTFDSGSRTAARQHPTAPRYSTVRLATPRRRAEGLVRRLPAANDEAISTVQPTARARTVSAASEEREFRPDPAPVSKIRSKREPDPLQLDAAPAPIYELRSSSEEVNPESSHPSKSRGGNRLKPARPEELLGEATPARSRAPRRAPLAERLSAIDAQPITQRAALEGTIRAVNLETGSVKIAFDRKQPPVGGVVKVYEYRDDETSCLGALEVTGIHQGLVTATPLGDLDPQTLAHGSTVVYCLKPGPDRLSKSGRPEVVWVSDR
jgi:hypothetical protein